MTASRKRPLLDPPISPSTMPPSRRRRQPHSPLRLHTPVLLLLLSLLLAFSASALSCDGSCSGHGACDHTTGRCECFPGYLGVSCKSMACPQDVAWADYATATDTAHAMAECSNMGKCDRTTGLCQCASGFDGAACERMSCPPCLNGRCVSMREAAQINDGINFFAATTYAMWDADKIFGCQCDNGFSGWDCSLRECPKGDDPLTVPAVDETQHLNCLCDGCTGSFALTFRRRTTRNLLPSETAATLKAALEALDTIVQVSVSVSTGGSASDPICDADGATTTITFTHNPGDLPPLQIQNRLLTGSGAAPVLTLSSSGVDTDAYDGVVASVDGTREEAYCSNRGVCDFKTGVCTCMLGYASSNGAGASGTRGDCGFGSSSACPSTSTGLCNLRGTCLGAPTWQCACVEGFTGPDCTQRTCPSGLAWFDGATGPDQGHAMAECSNKGSCDISTGLCQCHALFSGSACEVLKCPNTGSGASTMCSGHGACKTMQQLALAATTASGDSLGATYGNTLNNPVTWDYNKIQGCDCTDGYYMGAYSSAFGEFRDYDCSSKFCPVGADPYETGKVNEIQTLSCLADGGTFTLTFRQQTTSAIAFDANAATLKTALEKLGSIHSVTVVILGGGGALCDGTTAISTTIEFTFEQGDLPLITASAALLTITTGTKSLNVVETEPGTKASIECSARGLCDRTTGVCKCFNYFLSSNGDGNLGTRGDCGYISPYSTL